MNEIDFEKLATIAREEFNKIRGPMSSESTLLAEYVDMVKDILQMDPKLFSSPIPGFPNVPLPLEDNWIYKFKIQFKSRQELIDFADGILTGNKIAAVDGSQIYEDRMIKIPIGLVRVLGICVTYDGKTLPKILDEYYGINSEMKLPAGTPIPQNALGLPNDCVDAYRSFYEHNLEIKLMNEKPALIFSDNPLIQTYLLAKKTKEMRNEHIHSMMRMLYHSKMEKIPVVGLIDSSQSQEFCTLVKAIHDVEKKSWDMSLIDKKGYHDAHLWSDLLDLYDRTCVFQSQHEIMNYYSGKINVEKNPQGKPKFEDLNFTHDLCFYYTRLSPFGIQRVEVPYWIMKRPGLIDQVHKYVCAQAALGEGHPHLLMQAHNFVVIRNQYSKFFVNVLLQEAQNTGITFRGSTKELRKLIF